MVAMMTPNVPVMTAVMLPPAPVHLLRHASLLRGSGFDGAKHGRGWRGLDDRRSAGKRRHCDWNQPDASHVLLLVAPAAMRFIPLQSLRGRFAGFCWRGAEHAKSPCVTPYEQGALE